jgi:hypothetical protein
MVGDRGMKIVADGAACQAIVALVLRSHQDDDAGSSNAIRSACNLLMTCKGFKHAILGCQGLVPVDYRPATPEAAAEFASRFPM